MGNKLPLIKTGRAEKPIRFGLLKVAKALKKEEVEEKKVKNPTDSKPTDSKTETSKSSATSAGTRKGSGSWIKVVKKSRKKSQKTENREHPEDGQKTKLTRSPSDSARHDTGNMMVRSRRGDTNPTAKFTLPRDGASCTPTRSRCTHWDFSRGDAEASSEKNRPSPVTHNSSGNEAHLGGRYRLPCEQCGAPYKSGCSMELAKDLEIERPGKRNLEVILFGLDSNLHKNRILDAIRGQNESLKGVSLELRSVFIEK